MSLFSFITDINGFSEIQTPPPFILTPLLIKYNKNLRSFPFILTPLFFQHLRVYLCLQTKQQKRTLQKLTNSLQHVLEKVINLEAKQSAKNIDINTRAECFAKTPAFISLTSHQLAKFGGRRHCGSSDIVVLVCHVIMQDHVTKGLNNSMGSSPLN